MLQRRSWTEALKSEVVRIQKNWERVERGKDYEKRCHGWGRKRTVPLHFSNEAMDVGTSRAGATAGGTSWKTHEWLEHLYESGSLEQWWREATAAQEWGSKASCRWHWKIRVEGWAGKMCKTLLSVITLQVAFDIQMTFLWKNQFNHKLFF